MPSNAHPSRGRKMTLHVDYCRLTSKREPSRSRRRHMWFDWERGLLRDGAVGSDLRELGHLCPNCFPFHAFGQIEIDDSDLRRFHCSTVTPPAHLKIYAQPGTSQFAGLSCHCNRQPRRKTAHVTRRRRSHGGNTSDATTTTPRMPKSRLL
jgi:hypothetical protein